MVISVQFKNVLFCSLRYKGSIHQQGKKLHKNSFVTVDIFSQLRSLLEHRSNFKTIFTHGKCQISCKTLTYGLKTIYNTPFQRYWLRYVINHNIDLEEVTVPIQNHPKREQGNVEKDLTHIVLGVQIIGGSFKDHCASYIQISQILNM